MHWKISVEAVHLLRSVSFLSTSGVMLRAFRQQTSRQKGAYWRIQYREPCWVTNTLRQIEVGKRLTLTWNDLTNEFTAANNHFTKSNGEPGWDRTNDHLIKSQMLYR
jgi:hypothetical protein